MQSITLNESNHGQHTSSRLYFGANGHLNHPFVHYKTFSQNIGPMRFICDSHCNIVQFIKHYYLKNLQIYCLFLLLKCPYKKKLCVVLFVKKINKLPPKCSGSSSYSKSFTLRMDQSNRFNAILYQNCCIWFNVGNPLRLGTHVRHMHRNSVARSVKVCFHRPLHIKH